ncbi:MAG: ParB N-terminal domain-containing protein [Acidobacteria bacterium]|nr:ParB N-terminal domain-containing protein [Acidobacteriota bacterium]
MKRSPKHQADAEIDPALNVSEGPRTAASSWPDESRMTQVELSVEQLATEYGAIRAADPAAEEKLLASIARHGVNAPILVVEGENGSGYQVLDGFRRLRALRQLAIPSVRALVWPGTVVDGLLFTRRLQTSSRAAPLEEGFLIEALVERQGLSLERIALGLCRTKSWVHRRLSLVRCLPAEVRERVLNGELTGYVATKYAVPLARANDGKLVAGYCESVIAHGLSTRQAGVVYQYLKQTADPKIREEILARPERVLTTLEKSSQPQQGLEAVRRLERWCRLGSYVAGALRHLLEEGASEDVLERLILVWKQNGSSAHAVIQELDGLTHLSDGGRPMATAGARAPKEDESRHVV